MKVCNKIYIYSLIWFTIGYSSIIIASNKNNLWFLSGAGLFSIIFIFRMWTIKCPKCKKPVSGLGTPFLFTPRMRELSYLSIRNPRCLSCGFYLKNESKKS